VPKKLMCPQLAFIVRVVGSEPSCIQQRPGAMARSFRAASLAGRRCYNGAPAR